MVFPFVSFSIFASWDYSQTIKLSKGWNAIYLFVEPEATEPDKLFDGRPVDIVAGYFPRRTSTLFFDDPNRVNWKSNKWHRWLSPDRKDSVISNLYHIRAGQAYLVHATKDYEFVLNGQARFIKNEWVPNAFNFLGFSVDPTAPPTFAEYFSGATAHQDLLAYEFVDGKWQQILSPEATVVESGKAYWVYSRGGSQHQGPLGLKLPFGRELDFLSDLNTLEVSLENPTDLPISYEVFSENDVAGQSVPIRIELQRPLKNEYTSLNSNPSSVIAAESHSSLRLNVDRSQMNQGANLKSLLVFQGGGVKQVVPVGASR